jgi:uncharacterized repeat protein (TIGR03843 family)
VPALELTPDEIGAVLARGDVDVAGRMRYSSNGTFFVRVCANGVEVPAVYKPRRGERPLWDFPDGTLCRREVAAYEVSRSLGWGVVPVTVFRHNAPFGPGALQRFVEHDPEEHYFTLLADHADRFRQFAAFDIVVNNTDRKGGHCLRDVADGAIVGIDHGLTFHPVWKLRTVIWDFAGEPLPAAIAEDLGRLAGALEEGELAERLSELLSRAEVAATRLRAEELLADGHYPHPEPGYHSVPWPLV